MGPILERLRQRAGDGSVFVVARDGTFLLHPDRSRQYGSDLGHSTRLGGELPEFAHLAKSPPAEPTVQVMERSGLAAAAVGARLSRDRPLLLIETKPMSGVLAGLDSVQRSSLIAGLGAAILAMAFALVLARWLTKPLSQLSLEVSKVAEGTYRPVEVPRSHEVGVLAKAVNSMARDVQQKKTEIEQAHAMLSERALELARSNAELEQFARVASHDLKEPLRMVSSATQVVEKRYGPSLDDKARKWMRVAVEGAQRMATLIDDLLSYSATGRSAERRVSVPLQAVVDSALARLAARIAETGAEVVCGELPEVSVQESQLVSVFQNLFSNSMKFRGDRSPRIEVGAKRSGAQWEISVQDNGIGIAPEYLERVFEMFSRLHTRDEFEGNGIGLAVSKKTIESHGGKLWCESEQGVGTAFRFTLPVAAKGDASSNAQGA
jgi:signal transduction histidine kinase